MPTQNAPKLQSDKPPEIRDAATTIVMRNRGATREVLMGQRGAKAAFMPNKFVFPGGAVDPGDRDIALERPLEDACLRQLAIETPAQVPHALAVAAIRELWEETGLVLGQKSPWQDPPKDWQSFARLGFRPSAEAMRFVFRAITPPGRPRRFDARFFLIEATELATDMDDFSRASDELSHLQWIPLPEVRDFDLPFITEVVMAEIARLPQGAPMDSVPFFKNDDEDSLFLRLNS